MQHLPVLLLDRPWGSDLDIPAKGELPGIECGAGGEVHPGLEGAFPQVPRFHILAEAVDDLLHQAAGTAEGHLTGFPVVHLEHLPEVGFHRIVLWRGLERLPREIRAKHPIHPKLCHLPVVLRPAHRLVPVAVPDQVIRGKVVELAAGLGDFFLSGSVVEVLKRCRMAVWSRSMV